MKFSILTFFYIFVIQQKHRVICQKTKSKKRKVFDSTKKRVEVGKSF